MSETSNTCITRGESCGSATNFPQFIDTQTCFCAFISSREQSRNGNLQQLWRCIGDAHEDIAKGDHGKWYYPQLPSEESSGLNRPQSWKDNPPDLSKVYVLETSNNQKKYQELKDDHSSQLRGEDSSCTGKNSTQLSTMYYSQGKKQKSGNLMEDSSDSTSKSTSETTSGFASETLSSSGPATSSATSSSLLTTTTAASASPTTTAPPSNTSSAPASSASSDASVFNLKSTLLLGMLVLPAVAGLL